jgi:hypothetical protein
MALYASILTGGVNNHTTTSEEANSLATDFVSDGVIGDITSTSSVAPMTGAFAVNAQGTPDMTVAVTAGAAYITATPSGQSSQVLRIKLSANQNVTIAANSSGSTKYDYLYIKVDPTNAANPNLAGDDVASLVVSRSTSNSTDNGTPPTYGYLIAVITVANGASSITNGNIRDIRVKSEITGNSSSISTGWVTGTLPPVNSVTDNGNNSYTLNFASAVDTILSEGMRVRTTRNSAAGVTCFSLDGSNDYLNKTSPAGMTFTDDFTVSAWIYLTSYASVAIASRFNGTSGWQLYLTTSGQVELAGYNGAAGNNSSVRSYQSVPLNKWVHVAAQLDMSTFTATTTTSYVMINGKDIPAIVQRSGTNPTALVQAGNLEIGSNNGGGAVFPGYIKDVAIYNSKITQATISASRNQPLTGSEANLISAYSGANTTDLNTTNANNLTAQNGAVTGFASAPWGNRGVSSTLDYGLVMAIPSSTSAVIQVPEGCTIPTTGGVSQVSYSVMASPFGFVSDKGRWTIVTQANSIYDRGVSASGSFTLNQRIGIPAGAFSVSLSFESFTKTSVAGTHNARYDLNTADATTSATSQFAVKVSYVSIVETYNSYMRTGFVNNSSFTNYYFNVTSIGVNYTGLGFSNGAPLLITATPAGL